MRLLNKSLITLAASLSSSIAMADATINVTADEQNATLMVQGGKVLMKSDQQDGESIFDTANNIFYVIDHAKKTITPIDQATVAKLSGTVGAAMSAVSKQLENLPPEQRAQMEALMGGMGLSAPKAKVEPELTLSPTGSASYHDINCEQSNVQSGAETIGTVCLTNGNSTPLSDNDYQTLLATQNFMFNMAKEAGDLSEQFGGQAIPNFGDIKLDSLIIHSAQAGESKQVGGINVTSINTNNLDTSISLPENYRTEDLLSKMQ